MYIAESKKLDKALELMLAAREALDKQTLTEDEFSQAIGNMKRAENILWDIQSELCDTQDDN
jgi:hypothetical protein